MTPRTILILALRVLGFWCLVSAIVGISSAAATAFQYAVVLPSVRGFRSGYTPDYSYAMIAGFVQPVIYFALAAILGLCAPGIASFYYRADEPPGARTAGGGVALMHVYRIVIQGLGVFTCLRAVSPIARILIGLGNPGGSRQLFPHELATMLEVVLYVACGAILIGCAGMLARWATAPPRERASRE
jgi:hypothetical protein